MNPSLPATSIAEYIVQHPKESVVIFSGCVTIGLAVTIVGVGGLVTVGRIR